MEAPATPRCNQAPGPAWKSLARCARFVWVRVPAPWVQSRPFRLIGKMIYDHVTRFDTREQSHSTWFLRNRHQIRVLSELILDKYDTHPIRIASIGCSTGAELYTALFIIRSGDPEARIIGTGVDMSAAVVDIARDALYSTREPTARRRSSLPAGAWELSQVPESERQALFEEAEQGFLKVREWIRADTHWLTADATDPALPDRIGLQEAVLANNFLGPMDDALAEVCVRNILKLVRPGGYLVVDGMDLGLRARLFPALGLTPILDDIEQIYYEDPTKLNWPWDRWAHEPLDFSRPDWQFRYCSIFRKTETVH